MKKHLNFRMLLAAFALLAVTAGYTFSITGVPVLVQTSSGGFVVKSSFSAAVSAADTVNKTIYVMGYTPISGTITVPATKAVKVVFGGYFSGTGSLVFGGPFECGRWRVFENTGTVSGLKLHMPEYWGAKADNSTDCWAAFKKMAESVTLTGGGEISLVSGVYKINQYKTQTAFQFDDDPAIVNNDCFYRGCKGLRVVGYGAKIDLKGDVHLTADYAAYPDKKMAQVFRFQDCERVRVEGLEIDGNADQLTRDVGATGESSGPLVGFEGCRDSIITQCKLHHGWVEGAMVYKYAGPNPGTPISPKLSCRNITIENSEIYANGRNNIGGIEFRGLAIRNCRIYDGGRTGDGADVAWYSPGSNIDIEPDSIAPAVDITPGFTIIENCSLKNARQTNVTAAVRNTHVILRNCEIDNPGGNQQPVVMSVQYATVEDNLLDMGLGRMDLAITGSQPGKNMVYVNRNEIHATNGEGLFIVGQEDGPNIMTPYNHPRITCAMVTNNRFINDGTVPLTKYFPVVSNGSSAVQVTFRDNYIFIPATAYSAGSGQQIVATMNANLLENNVWETDLDSTTDFFAVYYQPLAGTSPWYNGIVRNERFLAPGATPTTRGFRPADNSTWNTDYAFGMGDSVRHLTKSTTIKTLTYGATVNTDAATGSIFVVPITNNTAFTIASPTNPVTGQEIAYWLKNTAGSATGAITWGAAFKTSAAPGTPTNGFTLELTFVYDGQYWRMRGQGSQVAN